MPFERFASGNVDQRHERWRRGGEFCPIRRLLFWADCFLSWNYWAKQLIISTWKKQNDWKPNVDCGLSDKPSQTVVVAAQTRRGHTGGPFTSLSSDLLNLNYRHGFVFCHWAWGVTALTSQKNQWTSDWTTRRLQATRRNFPFVCI